MKTLTPVALPIAALTVVCAGVAALVVGLDGVLGALLGGAVVVLFLGSTPLILEPMVAASPSFSPGVAVLFFGTKTAAAAIVLVLLFDVGGVADRVDAASFGVTAAVVSMAWTVLQLVIFRKRRVPTYDLSSEDS